MNITDFNPRLKAGELFSSALCNLNCSYCYIPKNNAMIQYQKKIIESIENGTFIKQLEKSYGKNLEYLGLWGAEQTLILDKLTPYIKDIFEHFPDLKQIGFSTNLVQYPEKILDFILEVEKYAKPKINIEYQVSLDGPAWLNDVSRGKGTTEKVLQNIEFTFKKLNDIHLNNVKIHFNLKPTCDIEAVKEMNKDFSKLIDYYKFFSDICGKLREWSKDSKTDIWLPLGAGITLAVPGKYTSEDGKQFAYYMKQIDEVEKLKKKDPNFLPYCIPDLNDYYNRFVSLMKEMGGVYYLQPENSTCSGGDTQWGINLEGNMTLCHRLFLYDNEDYVCETLKPKNNIENWEISKFDLGIIKHIQKNYIMNVDDSDLKKLRTFRMHRAYHDNIRFKISSAYMQIVNCALCGQINKIYAENQELAVLLAIYLNSRLSCPAEDVLETGSLHLIPVSLIRYFGNGAFEHVVKKYFENFERKEQ